MAKNSTLSLQKNIKENAEEIQDFLRDLKAWEKDIKTVDKKLSSQKNERDNDETTPPVRCKKVLETSPNEASSSVSETRCKTSKEDNRKKNEKISAYDYASWDKFDVDKALESPDEDDTEIKMDSTGGGKKTNANRTPKASKKERAIALKDEGNKLYSSGRLDDAIAKYTQGMALDPTNALLPANRAMAYIKIKKFKAAEADCDRCLKLDKSYVKGYLRRATARKNLNKVELALKDYLKVLEIEPWNKEAKKELDKQNVTTNKESAQMQISNTSDDKAVVERKNEMIAKTTVPKMSSKTADTKDPERNRTQGNKGSERDGQEAAVSKEKSGKKLKIIEVNSSEKATHEVLTDPNQVFPINKPPHLQSTKPLRRIPVLDVLNREDIGKEVNKPNEAKEETSTKNMHTPSTQSAAASEPELKEVKNESKVLVTPQVPRTSHQFTQEWTRVSRNEAQAVQYLKVIPPVFISSLELEADTLMEIVKCLKSDTVVASTAAQYLLAISKSIGFSVALLFLDDSQKKVLLEVIRKCDGETEYRSQFENLKTSLV